MSSRFTDIRKWKTANFVELFLKVARNTIDIAADIDMAFSYVSVTFIN